MSLYISNPEINAKIAMDRRNSSIVSIVVGVLLMILFAVIFYFIGIKFFVQNASTFTTDYEDPAVDVSPPIAEKIKPTITRRPDSSSISTNPVIITHARSAFTISVPDVPTENLAVDFGAGGDFGSSWNVANSSDGAQNEKFKVEFINTTFAGDRICFVIDYSGSMKGKRINLLKQELKKTVEALPDNLEYQMIFFAGPAWIAGSEVDSSQGGATISFKNRKYEWKGQGAYNWRQIGRKQPVKWMKANDEIREKSLKSIRETALVWGTSWDAPLEMAMDMKPKPDMIVFLTDGASGAGSLEKAKRLGNSAKSRGITVNTIALMEPQAKEAMAELARRAGGTFAMIDENGKKEKKSFYEERGIKKYE